MVGGQGVDVEVNIASDISTFTKHIYIYYFQKTYQKLVFKRK